MGEAEITGEHLRSKAHQQKTRVGHIFKTIRQATDLDQELGFFSVTDQIVNIIVSFAGCNFSVENNSAINHM